jgi:hypothetical protein
LARPPGGRGHAGAATVAETASALARSHAASLEALAVVLLAHAAAG